MFTSTEATREDYEALKKSISPPAIIEDEVLYDSVNFRAFLVSLPNCTILTLLENPIVLTVSNNAAASVGNTATASAKTTRSKKVTEEAIQPRAIVPKRLVEQQQSPFHLNWLSALWNQQEQNGEFLAFEDFLYEDFTDHSNPAPIIYVVDTGAKPHNVSCITSISSIMLTSCVGLCLSRYCLFCGHEPKVIGLYQDG